MPYLILLLLSFSAFSLSANQTTHCQKGDAVRLIAVVYPQGGELPCEVQYRKDGNTSVLWRASNEAGYCEQKAAEFAEQQRGWGWQCVTTANGNNAEPDNP